jgi:hypothetical protein
MDNRLIFRYPLWSAHAESSDAKPVKPPFESSDEGGVVEPVTRGGSR